LSTTNNADRIADLSENSICSLISTSFNRKKLLATAAALSCLFCDIDNNNKAAECTTSRSLGEEKTSASDRLHEPLVAIAGHCRSDLPKEQQNRY
jgi:hypothetical protein